MTNSRTCMHSLMGVMEESRTIMNKTMVSSSAGAPPQTSSELSWFDFSRFKNSSSSRWKSISCATGSSSHWCNCASQVIATKSGAEPEIKVVWDSGKDARNASKVEGASFIKAQGLSQGHGSPSFTTSMSMKSLTDATLGNSEVNVSSPTKLQDTLQWHIRVVLSWVSIETHSC